MSEPTPILMPRYRRDQKVATLLANALMELPDEWVMCRDMRHAWGVKENFHVTQGGKRLQEIERVLICSRCETLRVETYNLTRSGMEKVRQHYEYPDHYQIKGVPRGNKPQSMVQAEQYRRVMEAIAQQHATGA